MGKHQKKVDRHEKVSNPGGDLSEESPTMASEKASARGGGNLKKNKRKTT